MSKHGKVLVAMSGGIDSTVCAIMLHEEGMRWWGSPWRHGIMPPAAAPKGDGLLQPGQHQRCPPGGRGSRFSPFHRRYPRGIRRLCHRQLRRGVPGGRTPNPCVLCNTHIKWEALLKRADQMDCGFIATGHYAQLREREGRFYVAKGKDEQGPELCAVGTEPGLHVAGPNSPLGTCTRRRSNKWPAIWASWSWPISRRAMRSASCPITTTAVPETPGGGLEERVDGGLFVDKNGKRAGQPQGLSLLYHRPAAGTGHRPGWTLLCDRDHPREECGSAGHGRRPGPERHVRPQPQHAEIRALSAPMEAITKVRYKTPGAMSMLSQEDDDLIRVSSAAWWVPSHPDKAPFLWRWWGDRWWTYFE